MKTTMTSKQELIRLGLASVALLLAGLLTTPLLDEPTPMTSAVASAEVKPAKEPTRAKVKKISKSGKKKKASLGRQVALVDSRLRR